MSERLEITDQTVEIHGRRVRLARVVRDDGMPRRHHRRCPTRPGEIIDNGAVCMDCVYGHVAERES